MNRIVLALTMAGLLTLIVSGSASAQGGTPQATLAATEVGTAAATPNAGTGVRNKRYCEVLTVNLKQGKLVASVYNTLGHNDCPAEAWKAMDVNAIKKQFSALNVLLNGPRYWMMDQIIGKGVTQAGETVTIGGLDFTKRAEVVLNIAEMKTIPYQVRNIDRETHYIFEAGKPIYELVGPDGATYVMQTYSQQVDATLTMDGLATLGDRLKLPDGWKYQVVTPEHDLILSASGVAHLVQDDLDNSYQRIEAADLATPAATEVATPSAS